MSTTSPLSLPRPLREAFTSLPSVPLATELGDPGPAADESERGVIPASLAVGLPDGSARCNACAHRYLVLPGRLGICAGNAPELGGSNTYCASCDRLLIRRRGYRLVENALLDGCCPARGTHLAGIGLERSRRAGAA